MGNTHDAVRKSTHLQTGSREGLCNSEGDFLVLIRISIRKIPRTTLHINLAALKLDRDCRHRGLKHIHNYWIYPISKQLNLCNAPNQFQYWNMTATNKPSLTFLMP